MLIYILLLVFILIVWKLKKNYKSCLEVKKTKMNILETFISFITYKMIATLVFILSLIQWKRNTTSLTIKTECKACLSNLLS